METSDRNPSRPRLGGRWAAGLAILLIGTVFVADLIEPSDNVSICFAYTLPILVAVYADPGSAYRLAALSSLASLAGSFVRPPTGGIEASFIANRVIAVGAQWLVAHVIEQRRRGRLLTEAHLREETRKAETGQRFVRILTHEIATALTSIDGQSYRLDAFVGRIRLASEVGHGELGLSRGAIDAAVLLGPFASAYEAARIRLDVGVPEPALYGDSDLIYQAVSNLVANAVKYSPAPALVTVSVARSDRLDGTVIAVTDCGPGIPEAEINRVTEPYYRARNSGGIPGAGLGLHLVHRYVTAHGGELEIDSGAGRGTAVRLHLPGGAA